MRMISRNFYWFLIRILSFCGFVIHVYSQSGVGPSIPIFSECVRIQASGTDMHTGSLRAVPVVVDWNSDGKKDMLLGHYNSGGVYVFLNSGTNSDPEYTISYPLKADGCDISVNEIVPGGG